MADEQDIGKGSEHVRFERKDRTAESTAEDSVVAGDQKQDHQQRHQEMKVSGCTFQGMNKLYQHETGNQVNDGSGTLTDESVTIVALNPDGSEVKASGKTGLSENDLEQAALTTRSRHGHTINPTETMLAKAYDPTHETTLPIEQNLESALLEKYHHGEPLTLSEFLQLPKGVSPVVDAYRSSLAKLNG